MWYEILLAVRDSIKHYTGLISQETFKVNSRVRQGGCSSCPLFTFFVDCTIDVICSMGPTLPTADSWYRKPSTRLCPGLY